MHAQNKSQIGTRYQEQDGRMIVTRTQDCNAIAEYAKAQHNAGYHGSSEVKHAASIPLVIVEKYCNDRGVTFAEFMTDTVHMKRCVEDPDNAAFRIWKGAL